ncbi:Cyclin-dependent kinase 2-associated protein 1 [Bulinus truncatus]|nr:Cyclin-dependent kinase 2-associated protein 1 [Bulinus truncatus]
MADEDASRTDSRHSSSPATPSISNPGTPRSELSQDIRATPPLARATPPLARATPPLARATPPLTQGPAQLPHGQSVLPVRNVTQAPPAPSPLAHIHHHQSKYASLLAVIEDMGRDIRPTYAGNRSSTERLKRSIVHARILVRECLMECERSART